MTMQTSDSKPSEKLKEKIRSISNQFLQEATQSPTLLADMAAMEKYMAESYSGRIFIEMLQNADDCMSTKVLVKQLGRDLYFANDGRPFDDNDLMAICRTGASSKQRGVNIGYRGVGFKSTTFLSEEILIWSCGVCFTFSKKHCASYLNISEVSVPTVRIPFEVNSLDSVEKEQINLLDKAGYKTVFIFKNARMPEFAFELDNIENGYFLFLNSITSCIIQTKQNNSQRLFQRMPITGGYDFLINDERKEQWRVIKSERSAIAFKTENGEIVDCSAHEATYHSYLPTQDKAPFKIKINSDFSTDPSRKHLIIDAFTENAIKDVSNQIFELLQSLFIGGEIANLSRILLILTEQISFSKANSILIACLKEKMLGLRLRLINGRDVPICEYKLLPEWLEPAEVSFIRKYSPYVSKYSLPNLIYDNILGVDSFLLSYSTNRFSNEDLIQIISDENLRAKLSPETYRKILAYVIKQEKIDCQINNKETGLKEALVPLISDETKHIAVKGNSSLASENGLEEYLSVSELNWLKSKTGIGLGKIQEKRELLLDQRVSVSSKVPVVAKWRSAEQQAVQIEEFLGNRAVDVSKKNVGYDIESTTPAGGKRYIEVKLLQNDYSGFSITNNEYTSAHQFADEYFICLIFENKAIYIQNPLKNLSFEKRIRQWEWLCEQYSGQEIIINTK